MEEAGLTAGAFYAHFDSKQSLLAEAVKHAAVEVRGLREPRLEGLSGPEWIDAFLSRYLSLSHCRDLEDGCPLPALVSEVSRADKSVKQSFEIIVRELAGKLASHATEGVSDPPRTRTRLQSSPCASEDLAGEIGSG